MDLYGSLMLELEVGDRGAGPSCPLDPDMAA